MEPTLVQPDKEVNKKNLLAQEREFYREMHNFDSAGAKAARAALDAFGVFLHNQGGELWFLCEQTWPIKEIVEAATYLGPERMKNVLGSAVSNMKYHMKQKR